MLEFYSGAAGLSGRFTEGFSLRRLQLTHPGVGYSAAEDLMLVTEEAVEIRVFETARQENSRDRSDAGRVTQHSATLSAGRRIASIRA